MVLQDENKQNVNLIKLGYIILTLSLFIVGGLFGYNVYLENKIENLEKNISQFDNSIKDKQKDRNIQVYNLLKENKKVIEELDKKSKINNFIYHVREIQNTYGLVFKGFNYVNGVVSMTAYVPFNTDMTASNRASYFIKSYREDKKSLFDLDFINTFNGFDSMTFSVNLKLK